MDHRLWRYELDIRYGHRLKRIHGTLGNVKAELDLGVTYDGALIVDADGVRSTSMFIL